LVIPWTRSESARVVLLVEKYLSYGEVG